MMTSGTTDESWNVASSDMGATTVTSDLEENVNENREAPVGVHRIVFVAAAVSMREEERLDVFVKLFLRISIKQKLLLVHNIPAGSSGLNRFCSFTEFELS